MIAPLADPIVDAHSLWKIAVAALVGGGGVVIAFSIGLVSLSRARGEVAAAGSRLGYLLVVSLCGAVVAAAIGVGIWAMTQK